MHKVQDKSLCDCLWFSFTLGIALALYLNHTLVSVSGKDRQLILHIVCGVEREPVSDFFAVMISDFKHSLGHTGFVDIDTETIVFHISYP